MKTFNWTHLKNTKPKNNQEHKQRDGNIKKLLKRIQNF